MIARTVLAAVVFVLLLGPLPASESTQKKPNPRTDYPAKLEGARVEVYKTIGDIILNVYIYQPKGRNAEKKRPAIVFFFGGGWTSGSPKQFESHCKYFASRGMVAMAADYRVASRHRVKAVSCVADAKTAVRWIRAHADELGVDSDRIVASGGSAGGHIAACTGTIAEYDEQGEDLSISSRPNAMVLFNPALVLAPVNGELPVRNVDRLSERTGVEPITLSPFHHVKPEVPPTLILHGKKDVTVPYKTVEWFTRAMTNVGNRCELAGYDDAAHGFFNFGRGDNKHFVATVTRVDQFLASLGYLNGPPTVEKLLLDRKSVE